jgi:hypothetical protein
MVERTTMIKRILMFATVLVLLTLVLLTPLFLNRESSPGVIPRLDIDHAEDETRIYVHGAIETTRYPYVTINVRDLSGSEWNVSETSNSTILAVVIVKDDQTTYFELNITLMRGEVIFEYDCIVEIGEDQEGETIRVYLPDRDDPIVAREDAFPYRDVIVDEVKS